ncbi:MAG TPA: cobyric acid synthase [Chitinispirillaceae bacterium]|nr:cobyric acid synthase [Chitinispirillaceae bacterium]
MIQGTASSSGKSLITAALCRIFHQDGCRVAPFKAQNMSNNSFVTRNGLEMGRAQVVQAYAAGLEPDVRMNPVLLKPSSDAGSQVVLRGKPVFTMSARDWHQTRSQLRETIRECYDSLAAEYDLLVIEGAGSPAEINLKKNDIVNMGMAKMADAPVVIVGDIDRGGVFASLVGTMQLLDPEERARVKGFIINKFRGNVDLLKPGLDELERITGIPVLGVIPWISHAIDDEDSVTDRFAQHESSSADIDICIVRPSHISNFTDFIPLEMVPGVRVRWCIWADEIGTPDLLIIPGTKATIADLQEFKKTGIADQIVNYARNGGTVIGICGGFQMLGNDIRDPDHFENNCEQESGLQLLDMSTIFHDTKCTVQTKVNLSGKSLWLLEELKSIQIDGYEIHMGQSEFGKYLPFTTITDTSGSEKITGIADTTGRIAGTYCHGFFDSKEVVSGVVNALRIAKGLTPLSYEIFDRRHVLDNDLNRLADVCREALSMNNIRKILEQQI